MASIRIYNIPFFQVSVTAVQDLFAAYAGANMALEIISITLGQIGQTSAELLEVSLNLLPATVTAGSGGTAPTPNPDASTNQASTFTARVNDTTPATSSGTILRRHVDVWNLPNGYQWIFPERARPSCKPSEALIFKLERAPAAGRTVSGTMKVGELF